MLTTNEVLKILNNNKPQKNYTTEEANKIKLLLYQFGEIAFLQFKQSKNDEKSCTIHQGLN